MRTSITLVLLFISFVSAYSQNQIVGTWDVNWSSTKSAMTASENEKYTTMPSTTQERVRASFSSRTYTFFSDGRIHIKWESGGEEREVKGTWKLESGALTISAEGKENQYTADFSGTTITLTKKGERNLFSVIVLTKKS